MPRNMTEELALLSNIEYKLSHSEILPIRVFFYHRFVGYMKFNDLTDKEKIFILDLAVYIYNDMTVCDVDIITNQILDNIPEIIDGTYNQEHIEQWCRSCMFDGE